jgi:hypothetical protein
MSGAKSRRPTARREPVLWASSHGLLYATNMPTNRTSHLPRPPSEAPLPSQSGLGKGWNTRVSTPKALCTRGCPAICGGSHAHIDGRIARDSHSLKRWLGPVDLSSAYTLQLPQSPSQATTAGTPITAAALIHINQQHITRAYKWPCKGVISACVLSTLLKVQWHA